MRGLGIRRAAALAAIPAFAACAARVRSRTAIDRGASIALVGKATGRMVASARLPSLVAPGGGGIRVRCGDASVSVGSGESPATDFLLVPELATAAARGELGACMELRKPPDARCEAAGIRRGGKVLDALRCRMDARRGHGWKAEFPIGPRPAGPGMRVDVYEDEGTVLAATELHGLFALEKASGRLLWSFPYHAVRSPPAVVPFGPYYLVGPVTGGLPPPPWQTAGPSESWKPGKPEAEAHACRDCTVPFRQGAIPVWSPRGYRPHDFDEPRFAACGQMFVARAHSLDGALKACETAGRRHAQLLRELEFAPRPGPEPYLVTLYADSREFHRTTPWLPEWIAGETHGNGIYVTAQYDLDWAITHELLHLLIEENLRSNAKDAYAFIWFNEGLAEIMEPLAAGPSAPRRTLKALEKVRRNPIPFQEMISRNWTLEDSGTYERWHAQAASLVRFIRDRCGMGVIRVLLRAVGANQPLEKALAGVCSGRWSSFRALEDDWKASLQAGGQPAGSGARDAAPVAAPAPRP